MVFESKSSRRRTRSVTQLHEDTPLSKVAYDKILRLEGRFGTLVDKIGKLDDSRFGELCSRIALLERVLVFVDVDKLNAGVQCALQGGDCHKISDVDSAVEHVDIGLAHEGVIPEDVVTPCKSPPTLVSDTSITPEKLLLPPRSEFQSLEAFIQCDDTPGEDQACLDMSMSGCQLIQRSKPDMAAEANCTSKNDFVHDAPAAPSFAQTFMEKAPEDDLAQGMTHDLEMNFNKIAPFGKEDTAKELQDHAAKTQDTLVDAVENVGLLRSSEQHSDH